jgi:O-antigen/teichoic acid export membrane protein
MWMMLPFILNSLLNFVVSLLVAKFLGPAEYGRFVLALSVAVVLQTLVFDWLRLAATRFYSERDRTERPQIRATLDASFATLAALAVLAAFLLWTLKLDLPLNHDLAALAVGVAISNALFDTATALVRARFHDRAYGALVIAKNLLAFTLTVGGAFLFKSANLALVGMMISVAGCLIVARSELVDPKADLRLAERKLASRFLAYGVPIILANVLYQLVPLVNRASASRMYGFAEVGQMSLAFETGIRIVGAIGSAVDVILFQLAVRTEKTDGAHAARAQISRNLGVVFAVVTPSVAGVWLILPSFEALFVPENFKGPFAHYFSLMTPALFAFAIMNYGVNTAFQIAHKLSPLIVAALVASLANSISLMLLPITVDATRFAYAQSISSCAGLATLVLMLFLLEPMWPRARDILGAAAATAAMLAAGAPLRQFCPGVSTMAAQIAAGVVVYGALAYAFDVVGLRSVIVPKVAARLRPPQIQEEG